MPDKFPAVLFRIVHTERPVIIPICIVNGIDKVLGDGHIRSRTEEQRLLTSRHNDDTVLEISKRRPSQGHDIARIREVCSNLVHVVGGVVCGEPWGESRVGLGCGFDMLTGNGRPCCGQARPFGFASPLALAGIPAICSLWVLAFSFPPRRRVRDVTARTKFVDGIGICVDGIVELRLLLLGGELCEVLFLPLDDLRECLVRSAALELLAWWSARGWESVELVEVG